MFLQACSVTVRYNHIKDTSNIECDIYTSMDFNFELSHCCLVHFSVAANKAKALSAPYSVLVMALGFGSCNQANGSNWYERRQESLPFCMRMTFYTEALLWLIDVTKIFLRINFFYNFLFK